ncbi:hypothetical protein [Pedobacter sandarakinus]|uniref:hypothetical protein n=1 Tax=Pedobacter sandarakinus TaxID=353156 RepID=UPI00224515E9|nr:hypothetical protein [Pedobacter sandarakinus]MCX2575017.1 hypothetical protein [Pedobacter sandarakinus]
MDKELIEHITTQLQNHEEPYPQGAWERFSEKKDDKRRGFVLWPLWTAAAILLIFSGIFFYNSDNQVPSVELVKNVGKKPTNGEIPVEGAKVIEKSAAVKMENRIERQANTKKPLDANYNTESPGTIETKMNATEGNLPDAFASVSSKFNLDNNITNIDLAKPLSAKSIEPMLQHNEQAKPRVRTFEDLLAMDSKQNEQKGQLPKPSKNQKWEQDVYVAPAMGNDNKVNMNYGFSLSYAIANKLSISSGVSYASLSATQSQNASAPQSLSGRNLESVDAKVRGVNIPLELKYNISDKLYTGVGVSALAVINNAQQNTYLANEVQTFSSPTTNGTADLKSYIVTAKTTETQPESAIDPDKYIGFYNFSLGYKQKISKKNNIAIEPFLRLPMKTFSKDNLNLTNGGLRLKIEF